MVLLLVVGLAALLRFYALDGTSLWSDEGNTWALIQRSFGQIARDAAADIHPPGYYWLLKAWSALWGTGAVAMRALSATIGTLLVLVVGLIARQFQTDFFRRVGFPALAAFVAAVNPFQIYYSQEARMYILLALESALLFWALIALVRRGLAPWEEDHRKLGLPVTVYLLAGVAGLWTHYSFPVMLVAAVLAFVLAWWRWVIHAPSNAGNAPAPEAHSNRFAPLWYFGLLNLAALILFLPWLPTAIDSVLNWPKGGVAIGLAQGAQLTFATLIFGPLRSTPEQLMPWVIGAALLPMGGMFALWRQRAAGALIFWLLAPIALMFGLGLFSAAFLKFLLVASPAWCLLAAAAPHLVSLERTRNAPPDARQLTLKPTIILQLLVTGGMALAALVSLPSYYNSNRARDNYAGIAAYLALIADPSTDLVILDAPGQQEVWRYYDPGVPVTALPAQRPPDQVATEAALADATAGRRRIYALFWATDEADPAHIVETWLDRNAFKGMESWQGNVRFVDYTMGDDLRCQEASPENAVGNNIELQALCLAPRQTTVQPGDVLLLNLIWQTRQAIDRDLHVTVQILDQDNQVIAQRDGLPGTLGPSSTWNADAVIEDRHGLAIPLGTPPGRYPLIAALYDSSTGERLPTAQGDFLSLGTVEIAPGDQTVPVDLLPVQHHLMQAVGPLVLAGYDGYKVGFAHNPTMPLQPGDMVQFVLLWQAPDPQPDEWPPEPEVTVTLGGNSRTVAMGGVGYPPTAWAPGVMVRTLVQVPFDGSSVQPTLTAGDVTIDLPDLPH